LGKCVTWSRIRRGDIGYYRCGDGQINRRGHRYRNTAAVPSYKEAVYDHSFSRYKSKGSKVNALIARFVNWSAWTWPEELCGFRPDIRR
jgi:hypothetical protein